MSGGRQALLILLSTVVLGGVAVGQQPRAFVRVEGARLMIGDRPFFFVGANLNVMHGPDVRRKAAMTIAAAATDGLTVGRVWALGEGRVDTPEWKARDFLFRCGPEGWQEQALVQLDRVIAAAGEQGLRLIVTLSNRWADYGGIPMYLRWAGDHDTEAYGYTDRFFTADQVKRWFWEHVRRVVERTNSITGVPYRDDPTIMTWELQNEMSGTPESAAARRAWFVEIARGIREIDPHHLVVPGLIGYNLQLERKNWIAMCKLPEVSYCDQHIYPENHLRSRGWRNLRRYIDDRVQLAHHVVGKPIIFGEFGFADRGSIKRRAAKHARFLRRIFYDGGSGGLVWIYQPKLSWDRTYGVLVDRARYRPLRRALQGVARQIARNPPRPRNPRLGPEVGEQPIAPTHAMMRRKRRPLSRWRRVEGKGSLRQLAIPVDRFFRAWFEEAGSWDGGVLVHSYGRRTGWFEYRFSGPPFVPQRLTVRARLSSEYPSASAPVDGRSRVKVLIDGEPLGEIEVMPDDGVGAWYELALEDPVRLRRIAGGVHLLRFRVDEGPDANGVAIYGRETALNREPIEEPGPLTLTAVRRVRVRR